MTVAPMADHFAERIPVPNRFWAMFGCGWSFLRMAPNQKFKEHQLLGTYTMNVRFMDRLRLLVTGRFHVAEATRIDAFTNRSVTTHVFTVLSPGAHFDPPESWVRVRDAQLAKKFTMTLSETIEALPDEERRFS